MTLWDSVLQYEKETIVSQPRVTPGCTLGSVGIPALLNMAATSPQAPTEARNTASSPFGGAPVATAVLSVVDPAAFAPTEEHSYYGDDIYI